MRTTIMIWSICTDMITGKRIPMDTNIIMGMRRDIITDMTTGENTTDMGRIIIMHTQG